MVENHDLKGSSMNTATIELIEKNIPGNDWKVIFPETYKDTFLVADALDEDILKELSIYLNSKSANFRIQLFLKGVSVLCAYYFEQKIIRIASSRLGAEMFLIQEMQAMASFDQVAEVLQSDKFKQYKKHAECIASLNARTFPSVHELTTLKYDLVEIVDNEQITQVENESKALVDRLVNELNNYAPTLFERVSDFGLSLTAQYALLRIHLLKFLAILPSLDHDKDGVEVKRILLESIRRLIKDSKKAKRLKKKGQNKALPTIYVIAAYVKYVLFQIMPASPLAKLIRFSVRLMAKRFIAGETIETAEHSIKELALTGRDVTLDQLGELVVSEKEADHYANEVLKLIKGFSLHVKKGEKNGAGINRAHVSIKVSALCSDFKPEAFDYTYDLVAPRLKKILLTAMEEDVFINIDAEHYDYRDIVFKIYRKVLLETAELKEYKATGIVIQAYLRDGSAHLEEVIELAKERGISMPCRLVKGAYWDAETVEADAHNFNAPEFLNKEETDLHFRQLIYRFFQASPHIQLCIASHNFADHCFSETLREKVFPSALPVEHQCLHMTYEALSMAMAKIGWPVRNYVPIGSLLVGMAYLVRRIMENSSQVGVLTIMRSHKKNVSLVSAKDILAANKANGKLVLDQSSTALSADFFNVRPVRSYLDNERVWFEKSLENFKSKLGHKYDNGFITSGEKIDVLCSSDPSIVVGSIHFATKEDAIGAVETIDASFNCGRWAKLPWINRAATLIKSAELMHSRRNDLAALIVYEAGKTPDEALADVDEAIDFLNFYAREEGRYNRHSKENIARGATAVIAPWNFPLAIPCGMTVAALVAGNTVILKSAEQTPLIAQELVGILHEAGVPKDVLIHLPGLGEVVGQELISHDRIAQIVFTGSKNVGLHIERTASKRFYENKLYNLQYPVSVITEMGGKNAVIVTANAELDETVSGILYSAFGHAGQKCSAASRVIADNAVKDRLVERLKEAAMDIAVGEAFDFSTHINPLITKEDKERVISQVKEARAEVEKFGGKVVVDRTCDDLPGYCVGPAIFEVPFSRALNKESFSQRELFAPVVHVIGVDGLDQALQVYNSTDYALTGGIFSQSQDDIDYLSERMENGNIYINRSITGARVAIEPFGGFKMSGTGPKAGGRGYIPSFHVTRAFEGLSEIIAETTGSDYSFDLARKSKLSVENRLARIVSSLNEIENNFESLFQGIYGEQKKVFKKMNKWITNHASDFIRKPHHNRKIPGQLSFNDFTQTRGQAVVISYNARPEFGTIADVIMALTLGVGVTVLCRNEMAYNWWMQFNDIFISNGLSKNNFDVFLASEKNTFEAVKDEHVEVVILDANLEKTKWFMSGDIFTDKDNTRHMKKFHTVFDSPEALDFKRLASRYVLVRSFAVNVMRHGAPLELDI
ncbi:proline dehydrogenase family protein [Bacteriovorax sp. BSW11_IV]|nr:proline dehydrogenase family protein [Bacteriovorax sp. BSW11_IV]